MTPPLGDGTSTLLVVSERSQELRKSPKDFCPARALASGVRAAKLRGKERISSSRARRSMQPAPLGHGHCCFSLQLGLSPSQGLDYEFDARVEPG